MQLVIGYDGSACAGEALEDLRRAGLSEDTEATIVSAADLWPLRRHWTYEELTPAQRERVSLSELAAYDLAMEGMRLARSGARDGAEKLRRLFPTWRIAPRACPGPIAQTLMDVAAEQRADLLVVGTRARSTLRGLLLGSVSRRVMAHAPCSVRIGRAQSRRPPPDAPVRIVLGLDGSANALRAARSIKSRTWPTGTEVRVVAALDVHLISARCPINVVTGEPSLCDPDVDARTWIGRICDVVAEELGGAGGGGGGGNLKISISVKDGDAAIALLDEAEAVNSDCIFLGATGLRGLERFAIGSVAAAVAAHAPCSVEVVR